MEGKVTKVIITERTVFLPLKNNYERSDFCYHKNNIHFRSGFYITKTACKQRYFLLEHGKTFMQRAIVPRWK